MQGRKDFQPELFTYLDLGKLIPANHLLRRIDRVLDLGFIRKLTNQYYSGSGRPSIDPEVYFRIQLISYIYGIESDRQLCEEVSLNIAYRWFARLSMQDSVLDHSSLTRIRDRFGEELFEKVFIEIVNQCKKAGLVQGKRVIVDATLVEANASLKSLEPKNGEDERGPRGGRKLSNELYASKTDPESTLVARSGKPRSLCHKVHYAADASKRIITSVMVTTGNLQDHEKFIEQIKYCRNVIGLSVEEAVADKGYGVGSSYKYLCEEGIRAYIPVKTDRHREKREFGFQFDKQRNAFLCPSGKLLTARKHEPDRERTLYRSSSTDCRTCEKNKLCPVPKVSGTEARAYARSDYEPYFEKIRGRNKTPYFLSIMRQRSWKIEGLFAEAKQYCGMRRAKYRGRTKLQIQAYMTAITQNLRRLEAQAFDPIYFWILLVLQSPMLTRSSQNRA